MNIFTVTDARSRCAGNRRAKRIAPKIAPKTAPKQVVLEWLDHWHEYAEPRISLIRGKWHWCVTKPRSLQKPTDKDKRLSAKTTDKAVAMERKWAVVAKIYQAFDDEFQAQINVEKNLSPMERHLEFCNLASYLWAEQCVADRAEGLDFYECFEDASTQESSPFYDDVLLIKGNLRVICGKETRCYAERYIVQRLRDR